MSALTGQVTISGVTQLPDRDGILVTLKAHPDNTDTVWVGNDGAGTLSADSGYPLDSGEAVVIAIEGNLNRIFAVADVDNEKVCWVLSDE